MPFTPIFGGLIQSKNWRAMGESSRARSSMLWVWGTALYMVISAVLDIPRLSDLVLLLAWYFASGRSQIKFVTEKYGIGYEKKGWSQPLTIAFAIYGLLLAIVLFLLSLDDVS
jgi:hypothetical protein